ncbi:MAG: hypothetical protein WAN14_13325 [Candidatus Acidiferrales bacterium]
MKLLPIWRRLFGTKYSTSLEAEVARLRAENRALLNSILGIAGVPPITIGAEGPTMASQAPAAASATAGQKSVTPGSANPRVRAKDAVSVAAPTRRRSWHQVYRMLEIDSARKKEAG